MSDRPTCATCWKHFVPHSDSYGSCRAEPPSFGMNIRLEVVHPGEDQPEDEAKAKARVKDTAWGKFPQIFNKSPCCSRHPEFDVWCQVQGALVKAPMLKDDDSDVIF